MNMKMIKALCFLTLTLIPAGLMAQNERVGVQTKTPTEQLDVKGTVRVEGLPKKGVKITTAVNGTYDATKAQGFTPERVVVADANGVLGSMFAAWPLFFYMPSCVMPTDQTAAEYDGTEFKVDLYKLYKDQFTPSATPPAAGTFALVASPSAGLLPIEQKNELGYFVTYYDDKVFKDVKVDDNGMLTYKLVASPAPVTENTFMNIVFKRL